ncbi:MAG: TIGR04283 family arsenosugar biosynthesis glycosyltransferase [Hyphomicrobiales bacterium]|nr:TIGR04283 family arsenosugar biosynthesis glycosyltransferase [Hyphomicrobiales bacterium]
MISVVAPTLNAQASLGKTLACLVPAALDGLVIELIVADGGSSDGTLAIAEDAGAKIVRRSGGRGAVLRAGAEAARGRWLLFLHADSRLQAGWEADAIAHIRACEAGGDRAAAFRFALDDDGVAPRVLEAMVRLRCAVLKMPYGDQGLLISRALYDEIGGFAPTPIMEDVDIVRRLGRRRMVMLKSRVLTGAVRYRRDGYAKRVVRNLKCLSMYFAGRPPDAIAAVYEGRPARAGAAPRVEDAA